MFLGRNGDGRLAATPGQIAGHPLWHPVDSIINLFPERRRIVAQVRRKASKQRGFLAVEESAFGVKFC